MTNWTGCLECFAGKFENVEGDERRVPADERCTARPLAPLWTSPIGPGRSAILSFMRESMLTVGHLRAELVGVSDDVPVTVWLCQGAWSRPLPVTQAGWDESHDQDDPVLLAAGFPLVVEVRVSPER